MQTKLTLRLEEGLIRNAKAYAKEHKLSVSQLVSRYFSLLDRKEENVDSLPETTKALDGALASGEVEEADYKRYLEAKYL